MNNNRKCTNSLSQNNGWHSQNNGNNSLNNQNNFNSRTFWKQGAKSNHYSCNSTHLRLVETLSG